MADSDHMENEHNSPKDVQKKAGELAHEIAETVIETQQSVEHLKQKAADAEERLKDTEKKLKESEDTLKEEAGGYKKHTTVAGYPISELAMAPLKPPKPAEETEGDPEAQAKLAEVGKKKKAVEDTVTEVSKIKREAENFNHQEAQATKKLSDAIDEAQS